MGSDGCTGRTDNEIKNYWNTRIKRRQRAGLPLYPPDIQMQRKAALMNQRHAGLMLLQSQARSKNCISQFSPITNTLFNNVNANNCETNYSLGNFDLSLQSRQYQSPNFAVKMEHPSTQLYHNCIGHQKFSPHLTPQVMGQGNDAFFDDLPQEAPGSVELHNERLLFEQLPTNCTAMAESLPLPLSLPSNTKHLPMDPHYRLCDSDISIGLPAMKQSIDPMVNQNISNPLEMISTQATEMPADKSFDWLDSSALTEDELRQDIQPFNPNFSMGNDWNYETTPWENLPDLR